MKKLVIIFFAFTFLSFSAYTQEKLLTIEDVSYMNRALFPARISQLQWIGETDDYTYAKENAFYKVSAKRGTETLLIDLDMINAGLHLNGYDSVKRLPSLRFYDDHSCYFSIKHVYYNYNYSAHQLKKINHLADEEVANIRYHRKSGNLAFTIDNNLYYTSKGVTIQVTKDTDTGIVNGQTVHRSEFGINGGIFWSPNGSMLAFYRKDETMVTDYPLVDITKRVAEVKNTKYPMAGMTSEEVTLGIYDPVKDAVIYMKTGEPKDQYLTTVTWGPEGKFIYISILNRDQNHLKLNQYDVLTGDFVKTLFEETHPKYVEPENPLYFNPNNPDEFIWLSEKDGYNHLYLYNTTGEQLKQITNGEWVVTDFTGFFGKDLVYFTGTKDSPIENNIYSVGLKDGNITRVSPDHGTHSAKVSYNGKFIIDNFSSTDYSRIYKLVNSKGKELRILQEDNQPLKDYKLGEMKIFTLNASDGTELYSRLIKPIDFDPAKKYPVIVYVYGGPHAQLITDSWLGGAGLFLNYMAERGFVIFTLDNRGSANRGRDFEQAVFRNLGDLEMSDQMVGVEYLKSLSFIDPDRIGVDGWSYGGFMTTSLMVRHPETFKVGVAGGPVIDWQYYEVMYGERYMDSPQDNPEGYKKANLLNYVDNLQGKLLLIHGTNDPTVVWQHSLLFIQEAISKGKQMDYFVYPGHGHGVRGTDRIHLNQKIANYFIDNL
jgi:dipeptidyl-peptidase-4